MINYPSEEEQKEFYDKDADSRVLNGRLINIHRFLGTFFALNTKIRNVLEIGCGVGITSMFYISQGKKVLGVDISEKHIELCKKSVPKGNFIAANFVAVELDKDLTFDFISLFDVLEHIPKPHHKKVFEQLKRHSHKDTKIGIIIPEPAILDHYREVSPELLQPVDESIYPTDIEPLFEQFGMQVIEETKYDDYVRYILRYE